MKKIINEIRQLDETISSLKRQNQSAIINSDSIDIAIEEMKKQRLELLKEAVNDVHKGKISVLEKEGTSYYRTYIDGKSISAKGEAALYEKLAKIYEITVDDTPDTLEKIYPIWREHFAMLTYNKSRSYLTLDKYDDEWNRYFKNKPISKKKVEKLEVIDFVDFFEEIVGEDNIVSSKREYTNIRALVNQLLDFASTRLKLKVVNMHGVKIDTLSFREVDKTEVKYSNSDRIKAVEEAKRNWDVSDYYKAIYLHFYLGARIGEIRALQWKDFDFEAGTVYIHGYIKPYKDADGNKYELKTSYTKSHAENGLRTIPICGEVYDMFYNLYNQKKPDGEDFVFMSNGHFLSCDAYNHRLRAIADRIGIKYQSSHKIRFWYATNLFEKGVDERIIQKLMGHDNPKTTQHYNRSAKRHAAMSNDEYERLVY